jgi:hypothetical protein
MNSYAVWIAAAFIIATVAVAALSPGDHLPQGAPQTTAGTAPADQGSDSSNGWSWTSSSEPPRENDGSSNEIHWPPNEAPPQ